MRSAGTKAFALVTTSGCLVAILVTALYFSSVLIQRKNDTQQEPPAEIKSERTTTAAPSVSEEYVKPIKKWPPPFHYQDVLYPEDKQMKNDHHSGHFRDRVAQIWDPHPEYEFKGFGRTFHLQLSQSQPTFVIPNLKVAHVWDNVTRLEETPVSPSGCFYSGKVAGDPASNVFVNLCHGMTGHIRTSNGSFLIEPDEEWVDYKTPIRHILRRLDSPAPSRLGNCHTPESDQSHHADDETSRTRSKRSLSQEYYLELMVVVDRTMADHHGKDLNNYILNLMASASNIFRDASIGNMITVTVVSLIVAREEDFTSRKGSPEKSRNLSSSSASEMLAKFCSWQYNSSLRPHDSALLITRENICSNPLHDKCETLGLAEVGRVCNKEFSCALVKDKGLSTAYTIAHELGHVLNMPHDEDIRCQPYNPDKKSHVMARVLDNNTLLWSWSECSRHILTEFLHAGSGNCLLNPPQEDILPDRTNVGKFLGEVYDSDKQCELAFAPGWMTCNFNKLECRKMWCSGNSSEHRECRTGHMPWADGTPCANPNHHNSYYASAEGWCHKGECVTRDKTHFKSEDGEWGEWQEYGECSRTCGGGIKKAIRLCDSPPPANGGRYCIGQRVRYLSCNTQDCSPGTPDFREQQCAKYNDRKFKGNGLTEGMKWAPKYGGVPREDRCKLLCRVVPSTAYYKLADKVVDGTPCGPENTYDICVDGTCHRTGCDHVLDSKTELDMCGVCGGDNSTCLQKMGRYNESKYGYRYVVRIPKGASNLDIRQYAYNETLEDNNYIALVDSESNEYILNGNSIVTMFKKLILYEGTTLEYTGSGGKLVERVNSSLPLKKDLIIEVLSVKDISPPNLVYEYTVQKNPGLYRWMIEYDYTSCNKECLGERWRDYKCTQVDEEQEVAEEMCDDQKKPDREVVICNTHCQLSWEISSKSECTNPCGAGERTLSMQCVKTYKEGKKVVVYEEACLHIQRPPGRENCTGMCDTTGWKYSQWSPCSVTCGEGNKKRTAECVDSADRVRDRSECNPKELKLVDVCSLMECPRWEVGEWTPCSASCGRGVRHRPYYCKVGNRISKHMCIEREPPLSSEPCESKPCPYWMEVGESPCSTSCGPGIYTVKLECSVTDACSNISKPPLTRSCINQACSLHSENAVEDDLFPSRYSWRQKWSACSASCGHGKKTKTPQCFDTTTDRVVDSLYCPPLRGPSYEVNQCYTRCPQWKTDEWEPCSAICGEGFETRKVFCEGEDGKYLPDSNCSMHPKPIHERKCKATMNCPHDTTSQYEVGPWSECSASCGSGEQYRNVACRKRHCYTPKPPKKQPCNRGPCLSGVWVFGKWSACNVTCGYGYINLEVFCKMGDLVIPEENCPTPKPRPVQTCYGEDQCERPRWRPEKWSPCMLNTCTKMRKLYCANGDERVPDSECSDSHRPKTTRPCKRMCPNGSPTIRHHFVWRPGKWSQCSASCGQGKRTRAVHCVRPGGGGGGRRGKRREHVKESHCLDLKPHTEEMCEGPCGRKPKEAFTWEPGPWKPCSHPCSKKGKQERTLHCYNSEGSEVPKRFCPKSKKPANRRKCEDVRCPTCRDWYLLKKEEDPRDGEYQLYPRGSSGPPAKIYCSGMRNGWPKEYITVPDNNYAMIYHKDIRPPSPAECSSEQLPTYGHCGRVPNHPIHGFTVFRKLGINITSLQIIVNDWKFAEALRGHQVRVGEAGDCFSKRCPQGVFRINLKGTSFTISRDTQWFSSSTGTMRIVRAEDHKSIEARCGGCCGTCKPRDGIKLDLAPP